MSSITRLLQKILTEDQLNELVVKKVHYHFSLFENNCIELVAACLDSDTSNCGLSDRLRGIISAYAYSKCLGVPFVIKHKRNFLLEDYLAPNSYNWLKYLDLIDNNLFHTDLRFVMDHSTGERLPYRIKHRQIHIYSNTDFLPYLNERYSQQFIFSELFNELFRPSKLLEKEISKYSQYINDSYISISFRFMQLLGDFRDEYGEVLEEEERNKLIKKCQEFIVHVHSLHSNKRILITADSQRFIDSLSFNFIFTLPGKIGHIGHSTGEETMLKTFLDFYMISKAEKVYLGYSGLMYKKSKFCKSAALSTDTPFEAIEF